MPSYELSTEAEFDLEEITEYTYKKHGAVQTLKYIDGLEENAHNLASSHGHYKELLQIHPNLRMKHYQHHYIFGIIKENKPMLIIAILHERMKIVARLKKRL